MTRRMIFQYIFLLKSFDTVTDTIYFFIWQMPAEIFASFPTLARDQFSTDIKCSWKSIKDGAKKAQKYRTDILRSIKASVWVIVIEIGNPNLDVVDTKTKFWWNVFMAYK